MSKPPYNPAPNFTVLLERFVDTSLIYNLPLTVFRDAQETMREEIIGTVTAACRGELGLSLDSPTVRAKLNNLVVHLDILEQFYDLLPAELETQQTKDEE